MFSKILFCFQSKCCTKMKGLSIFYCLKSLTSTSCSDTLKRVSDYKDILFNKKIPSDIRKKVAFGNRSSFGRY